jgi:amino acid permease
VEWARSVGQGVTKKTRKGRIMGIMRTKSIEQSIRDTEEPEFQLRKALGPLDLTLFGIGVIIGTGLFVLTGEAAAGYAGPLLHRRRHSVRPGSPLLRGVRFDRTRGR